MHVLNRIIQRPSRDEAHLYTKHFVSCGCGWTDWFPSEEECEDAWIDHMTHQLVHDGSGNIVASFPRR